MSKAALRISDLPVGKTKAYEEIRSGKLRAHKCGRMTIIFPEDYERWLKSLPPIVPNLSETKIKHDAGVGAAGKDRAQRNAGS